LRVCVSSLSRPRRHKKHVSSRYYKKPPMITARETKKNAPQLISISPSNAQKDCKNIMVHPQMHPHGQNTSTQVGNEPIFVHLLL